MSRALLAARRTVAAGDAQAPAAVGCLAGRCAEASAIPHWPASAVDRRKRCLRSASRPGGAHRGWDLARLASRRVWEALSAGTITPTVRDAAVLMRLGAETDRDRAAPDPRWAATTRQLLWLCRKHLGDRWPQFAADVRADPLLLDGC